MAPQLLGDPGVEALKRRRALRVSVKLASLAGIVVFVVVFLQGMPGPGRGSTGLVDPAGIPAGSARLEMWSGRPVWIVNRAAGQLQALADLDAHVSIPAPDSSGRLDDPHRSRDARYGVYLAETPRQGILVQYVRGRPDRLAAGVPWHGGFIDPGSDALFDAAGRRYRTTTGPSLAVPPHRFVDGDIRLGEW